MNRSKRVAAVAALMLWGLAGCEITVIEENFEHHALGKLGSPWSVTSPAAENSSTASVVQTTDHGKALLLHGGLEGGENVSDFLIASLPAAPDAVAIVVEVSIRPKDDASFIWSFEGTSGVGYSQTANRIRLMRSTHSLRHPGEPMLVASTGPSGDTDCDLLPPNVWSRVTLTFHAADPDHTFDVKINDQPTPCTGIATGLTTPFDGVNVMDASNEGWGGDALFDDIRISTL